MACRPTLALARTATDDLPSGIQNGTHPIRVAKPREIAGPARNCIEEDEEPTTPLAPGVGRVGTDDGEVGELSAELLAKAEQQGTHFTRLTIARDGSRFTARTETAPLQAQVALGSGTIRSSLFAATDDANIPDAIASQMADMFSGDIDFHRELRKGDRFSIVYETLTADGEPITWDGGVGRLLAGEFTNNGRTYSAVWFKDSVTGKGSFYGFDCQSKRRAFLASPMEFSRITSGFAMRFHPIMQTWRQHNGVDYGAPTGTPVRSVGDGVVEMAGWQNGFGNVVHIRHSGDRTTVYAHLSRIDVKKGQRIEQGQRSGDGFALVLLDVDHFKQVNDGWGHEVGDRALRHLCKVLQRRLRKTDVIGRLGGEEFGLLLRGETVPVDVGDGQFTPVPRPLAALMVYLESIQR